MNKGKIISDPDREELRLAIDDAETCRQNLKIARAAFSNSENQVYSALEKLEALREVEPANVSQDHVLEALAAGDTAFDVSVLERPDAAARAREAKIEADIAGWRRARDLAEHAIPDREHSLEVARRKVEIAARVIISSSFDVDKMIADAEAAATDIVNKRAKLMLIRTFIEDGDDRKLIDNFLGRPWLLHEINGAWQNHPAVANYRDAYAALTRDATAPIPA
jgi:hypothetical protein